MTILFCDMDGVLCDFVGAASKLLGVHFHDPVEWKNDKGQTQRRKVIIEKGGMEFWKNLPWMSDGKQLWAYIEPFSPHILSAYADWDESPSKQGKLLWIQSHLRIPMKRIHLVERSQKKDFVKNPHTNEPNILIDDYERNIKEFKQAGGIGIHHVGARSTIIKLQELGYRSNK